VLRAGWLFPKRVGRVGQLDPALYAPGLITQANVTALYDGEPWEDLDLSSVEPLTFDPAESPRLAAILSSFQIFVEDHRQAIWEATHSFPISKAKQKAEAWAAAFYSGRKTGVRTHGRSCGSGKPRSWPRSFRQGVVTWTSCWILRLYAFPNCPRTQPGSLDVRPWPKGVPLRRI